ncbi:hypothetical protein L1887_03322 [Cichorium endivia]|nr:hypothetical protein L1887_03322 [Cichorium endivia]
MPEPKPVNTSSQPLATGRFLISPHFFFSLYILILLKRQSSGSSYVESSLFGDCFLLSWSGATSSGAGDYDAYIHLRDVDDGEVLRWELTEAGGCVVEGGNYSSLKSWAQQTEEGYQTRHLCA